MAGTKTNGVDGKDIMNGTDSNNDSMKVNQSDSTLKMPKIYPTPLPDIDYYYNSMEKLVGIVAFCEEQFRRSPEFTSPTLKEFLEPRARTAGHPLDGKMDNTKNYSDNLTFDNYGKLQLPFPEESYYFFMVTAVQKLENHAKALQNIDLTKEEAFIIFQACMIYISHNPLLQQRLQADDNEPACTGIRKMVVGRSNNGTIRLTPGEVVQLYKICKLIPRPKSVSELENPYPSDQDSDQDSSIEDAVNFEEAVKGCGIDTPMLDGKDDKKDIVSSVSFSGTEAAATIFSSIMVTIGMFERNSITGGVMKIGATSVHGVLKNCIALRQNSPELFVDHKENPSHPQICAFNKLYGAGLAAKSALLNAEEAASLLKLLERFPRNIVCDAFDGKASSADFRLMTQEEMTEKLSSGTFIMLSSDKAIGAIKNLIWLMVPTTRSISMGRWNSWVDETKVRLPFPDCGLPEVVKYTKKSVAQFPAKDFSDPRLKAAIGQLDLPSSTGLLAHVHWKFSEYPLELNDALVLRTQSSADIVANIGKKLTTALGEACLPNGGNQVVQLRSLEALALVRILNAAHLSLSAANIRVEFLKKDMLLFMKTEQHRALHGEYAEEAEKMSEFVKCKKFAIYGSALGGDKASTEAMQLAALAAERDNMASRQKCLATMTAWLMSMTQQLEGLIGLFCQAGLQGSVDVQELIKTELKSFSWRSLKEQLDAEKRNVEKAYDDHKAADATKKQRDHEQAQRLFQALADHVQKTSGKDTYRTLVWETCGSHIAGIVATDFPVPEDTPGLIANTILLDPCAGNDPQPVPGYELDAEDPAIKEEIDSVLDIEPSSQSSKPREWRRYLVADIKLRQEEHNKAVLDRSSIEDTLADEIAKKQQAGFRLSLTEQELQAAVVMIERLNQKERDFTARAAILIPDHNGTWVDSDSGEVNFDKVITSIGNLATKAYNSERRFQECEKDFEDFLDALADYVPSFVMTQDYTSRQLRNAKCSTIIKASKALIKAREDLLKQAETLFKQNETLRQEVAAKDRQLEGKEGDLIAAREFRGQIDERRKAELSKKESELTASQLELKSLQTDYENLKQKHQRKMEEAVEKIRNAKDEAKTAKQELNIAQLDEEAARNELLQIRADVQQLTAARDEAAELRKERDAQKMKFTAQKIDARNQKDKFDRERAEKNMLKGMLSRKEDEILSLQAKFAKFQEALEKAAAAKDEEMLKLREENSELLEDNKSFGVTIKSLEKEKEESEKANCELVEKVSVLSVAQEIAEENQNVMMAQLTDDIRAQLKVELEVDFEQKLAKERAKVKGLEGLLSMYISNK